MQPLGEGASHLPGEESVRGLLPRELLHHHVRQFSTQTLIDALLEFGSDRTLFATDWPFEYIDHAADWFEVASIANADRVKISRTHLPQLFRF